MKYYVHLIIISTILFLQGCDNNTKKVIVNAGNYERQDCIASIDIKEIGFTSATSLVCYEGNKPVLSQMITDEMGETRLFWVVPGKMDVNTTRQFSIKEGKISPENNRMEVENTGKELILKKEGQKILQYHFTFVGPPEGVDIAYGKSGFIHPVYSPAGNTLTTIQPRDHYHHYGIWNPWTRMFYDGKMYDLWNLGDKQGNVQANGIKYVYNGDVASGYKVQHDHQIFGDDMPAIILKEYQDIKAWNTTDGFLWDLESELIPATDLPVLLKEYRYAGFGYRATEDWTRGNSEMLTSEGKSRQQIDGSKARWIYVTGDTSTGRSGLLFMGHPENYNSPEPLRIWDENANGGRGDVFINFAPTKDKDWELKPGEKYKLRYRIYAYEGEMTKEKAEQLWNDFAYPVKVTIP